jgi:hypothetical protein
LRIDRELAAVPSRSAPLLHAAAFAAVDNSRLLPTNLAVLLHWRGYFGMFQSACNVRCYVPVLNEYARRNTRTFLQRYQRLHRGDAERHNLAVDLHNHDRARAATLLLAACANDVGSARD